MADLEVCDHREPSIWDSQPASGAPLGQSLGDGLVEKRRSAREKVQGRASFRETGSGAFEVELSDISPLGFCMQTFGRPPVGTHIWVKLPGLRSLEAIVRRSDGNVHGCEFIQPLHPAVSDHLVREWG